MSLRRRLHRLAPVLAFASVIGACGGGASPGPAQAPAPPAAVLSLALGNTNDYGNLDGQGRGAYFDHLSSFAFLPDGSIVAIDRRSDIRGVTPDGTTSTLAGAAFEAGHRDGPAREARFTRPRRITATPDGAAYVIEEILVPFGDSTHRLRRILPDGTVSTLAIPPLAGLLTSSPDGTLYLADHSSLYRYSSAAGAVRIAGGPGSPASEPGGPLAGGLLAIAADSVGNVYVLSNLIRLTLHKLAPDGSFTTIGAWAPDSADGDAGTARLRDPEVLAADGAGNLWVGQRDGLLRRVSPAGDVTTPFGPDRRYGEPTFLSAGITALQVAPDGTLWISLGAGLSRLDASGNASPMAGQDFPEHPPLTEVAGLAADGAGNVLITEHIGTDPPVFVETTPSSFRLKRWSTGGELTVVTAALPKSLRGAHGLAADPSGHAYISSVTFGGTSRGPVVLTGGGIVKVSPEGGVTPVASWPASGTSFGAFAPGQIASGHDGALVFIDLMTSNIVRWSGTGGAEVLHAVNEGRQLAADAAGRVYVTTRWGVRRIVDGRLETIAGQPRGPLDPMPVPQDGTGTGASFGFISGLAMDRAGNLYVGDGELVRRVTPDGVVTTVAGTRGSVGFRPGPAPGTLNQVQALAIGGDGVLHILNGKALVRMQLP